MCKELDIEKKILRKATLAKRRGLSLDAIDEKSKKVFAQLVKLTQYTDSKMIMCYAAMKDEVQTYDIIEHALNANKSVCIPRIRDVAGQMDAVLVHQLADLVKGKFDILTVRTNDDLPVNPAEIDCIILPGVAFDCYGHRLGMGVGFYDRFLTHTDNPVTIGLAFACQMSGRVPFMPHDCLVDYVLTEDGILNCKTGKM